MYMTPRQEQILAAIVDAYIAMGEPVGSKTLSEAGIAYSSATIRNEMSELSELGFLEQPHTSAGRIPSGSGLRFYVDRLMEREPVSPQTKAVIDSMLEDVGESPVEILKSISEVLAQLTQFVALSTNAPDRDATIKRIEIIPTGRRSALVVLMTNTGTVKNKMCRTDVELHDDLVNVLTRIINERMSNLPLNSITPAFVQSLAVSLGEFAFVMSGILLTVLETVRETIRSQLHVDGQMNLLLCPAYENYQVRELARFLSQPQGLEELLGGGEKTRVIIGKESRLKELEGSSVVVARYSVKGREAGTLGIIGPTRMNYAKIVSSVEYFANKIGKMMEEALDE